MWTSCHEEKKQLLLLISQGRVIRPSLNNQKLSMLLWERIELLKSAFTVWKKSNNLIYHMEDLFYKRSISVFLRTDGKTGGCICIDIKLQKWSKMNPTLKSTAQRKRIWLESRDTAVSMMKVTVTKVLSNILEGQQMKGRSEGPDQRDSAEHYYGGTWQ